MIVYCDVTDCKNNKDGECNNQVRIWSICIINEEVF